MSRRSVWHLRSRFPYRFDRSHLVLSSFTTPLHSLPLHLRITRQFTLLLPFLPFASVCSAKVFYHPLLWQCICPRYIFFAMNSVWSSSPFRPALFPSFRHVLVLPPRSCSATFFSIMSQRIHRSTSFCSFIDRLALFPRSLLRSLYCRTMISQTHISYFPHLFSHATSLYTTLSLPL